MLEDSGDEEETNGIVNKVLDEIGIEISGKVSDFWRCDFSFILHLISLYLIHFLDVRCTICN